MADRGCLIDLPIFPEVERNIRTQRSEAKKNNNTIPIIKLLARLPCEFKPPRVYIDNSTDQDIGGRDKTYYYFTHLPPESVLQSGVNRFGERK